MMPPNPAPPPPPPIMNGVASRRSGAAAGRSTALPPNIDPFAADFAAVGGATAAAVERISFTVAAPFALGGDVFVDGIDGDGDDEKGDGDECVWVALLLLLLLVVVVGASSAATASQLGGVVAAGAGVVAASGSISVEMVGAECVCTVEADDWDAVVDEWASAAPAP